MWNYNYIVPSFLVLVVFLFHFFSMPRITLRLNKTFFVILGLEIMTTLSDYVSSRADETYAEHSESTLYFLNMAFFVFFLMRIFWFYRFTLDALRMNFRKCKWKFWLTGSLFIFAELLTVSSVKTHAVFYIDESGYHRGPFYHVLAVCFFFYLALSVFLILIRRNRLLSHELLGALSFNAILIIGSVIRIIFPKYLIMDTFCLLAIIIIYLTFENPALYIDSRGAFNMKAFTEKLRETVGIKPFGILVATIRDYNDARSIYGGVQMDHGITLISKYLSKSFPKATTFYIRSGSFVLLGSRDMDWESVRENIRARFMKTWESINTQLDLTVDFVFVSSDSGIESADRLISYLILGIEKGMLTYDDSGSDLMSLMFRDIDRAVAIRRSLDRALDMNEVEVLFQPITDAVTGETVGAEALSRIRSESGELISPSEFIPIAERNGRIAALGEQVLDKTCAYLSRHDVEGAGISWININLSPIQCMRKDLRERFSAILEKHGICAKMLHLEITEQTMIDYSLLQEQIRELQECGFSIVLDDFGSGYSNIKRAKLNSISNIKLDMDIVRDYFRRNDELIPVLVHTFKRMGFSITAEGIENREMAESMKSLSCDYLQGTYYSHPLTMSEFTEKYHIKSRSDHGTD